MSVPPLLNLPDSSCIASVIMTMTSVVGLTGSPFTLEEQAFEWPGQQWSVSITLPVINDRRISDQWKAFGLKMRGRYGRVLIGDPAAKQPKGVATGVPVVDGSFQSGNLLLTTGWTPNVTGILLEGDYIQIGTGINSRLHMVVEDANSDASGNATLSLVPSIRTPIPTDGQAIITNEPKGVFRKADNSFSWGVTPGDETRFSFDFVEVVNA